MKKILLSPWLALITLGFILYIRMLDPTFVESMRLRYFDTLIAGKTPTENNIYTVNIDEATLDKYGQFPFKRDIYAKIIDDLYQRNAGLVVFNILMPEVDRQGGDAKLAETLNKYGNVVLSNAPSEVTKNNPKAPGSAVINAQFSDMIIQYPGIIANIPELENAAAGIGITNMLSEIDGVNRRIPLVITYNEKIYPSLSLETLRVAVGDSTVQVKLFEGGIEKMRIPAVGQLSTDALGRVWIDYSQKSKSFSAVDLPKDFDGGIVIVGVTAAGLANPLPTAIGGLWPQDVQAAVIGTLANGVNIQRPDWADGAEMLAWLVLGIIAIFLTRWKHGYFGIILIGILMYYSGNVLFEKSSALVDISYGILALAIVYLHSYTVKFITELNQKLQIKKQFGTYLSPALVEKLQKNPELLRLGGERRDLSIMFTDVRGFTTISEHYGDNVEGLTEIMNRYMTAMTQKILDNNGTLDKYIGDAQMAFWNAPLDDNDHAINAVKTGLQMLGDLDEFNQEISKEGIPPFGMGLGINTGSVIVGNMGSSQRFDYTCLGDAVNLASRLEGQSKTYGVRIILGEGTAKLVKDKYTVIELDTIAVKGKTVGVKVYTIADIADITAHKKYLRAYYAGQWDAAVVMIHHLVKANSELKQYYMNMLERLNEGCPKDWDGTYKATSK
jgi:adenylate cyclase